MSLAGIRCFSACSLTAMPRLLVSTASRYSLSLRHCIDRYLSPGCYPCMARSSVRSVPTRSSHCSHCHYKNYPYFCMFIRAYNAQYFHLDRPTFSLPHPWNPSLPFNREPMPCMLFHYFPESVHTFTKAGLGCVIIRSRSVFKELSAVA